MALNYRQKRFVSEFLKDLNASAAYIRAGYKATSTRSAEVSASRLLRNATVAQEVMKCQAEESGRVGFNAQRILKELAAIAFSRITNTTSWDPENEKLAIRRTESLPESVQAAIAEVSQSTIGKKSQLSVKLHDKLPALKLLAKYMGLDTDLNQAIAVLRRYGLILYQDPNTGKWTFVDEQATITLEKAQQSIVETSNEILQNFRKIDPTGNSEI